MRFVAPSQDRTIAVRLASYVIMRYIAPNTNMVRMRLEWYTPSEVLSANWHHRVDYAVWSIAQ